MFFDLDRQDRLLLTWTLRRCAWGPEILGARSEIHTVCTKTIYCIGGKCHQPLTELPQRCEPWLKAYLRLHHILVSCVPHDAADSEAASLRLLSTTCRELLALGPQVLQAALEQAYSSAKRTA